ncbi:small ribosomal subunit Rsm22 family protein [bacterium]|nr:small ribosomal subunit Rsm22 family protein [bacterium]
MLRSLENLNEQQLQAWEDALIAYMYQMKWQQTWNGQAIPKDIVKSICAHALKLSNAFTLDRTQLDSKYFNKKDVQLAYLMYFHLANVVRVAACLHSYLEAYFQKNTEKTVLYVLDLGSGWGATAWALEFLLKNHWPHVRAEVVLTDHNKAILEQAKNLFSFMSFTQVRVTTKAFDLNTKKTLKSLHQKHAYDLIVAANAINEVNENTQEQLDRVFTILWKYHLSADGAIAIMEPALMSTSRQLTFLRDQWLQAWQAYAPFPCLHHAQCPMNSDKKDWCHFETVWHAPNLRRKIERFLEHKDKALKASYIVLSKINLHKQKNHQVKARVISNELKLKPKRCVLVCTASGKHLVELDKSLKKNTYARGDLITISE